MAWLQACSVEPQDGLCEFGNQAWISDQSISEHPGYWFQSCAVEPDGFICDAENSIWVSQETLIDSVINFDLLGITPDSIAYVFAWGVGSVLTLWALGFAVGAVVRALRQL